MKNIMFRKKKGNSSGKILGWIVLIAWVFFFLKYSIGYVMFRYQIKTYSPVIATVTDYHKNKIETVGEEGQREQLNDVRLVIYSVVQADK